MTTDPLEVRGRASKQPSGKVVGVIDSTGPSRWGPRSATSCCTAGTSPEQRVRTKRCRPALPRQRSARHGGFTDEQRQGIITPEVTVTPNASAQQKPLACAGRVS